MQQEHAVHDPIDDPLIQGNKTLQQVTKDVADHLDQPSSKA